VSRWLLRVYWLRILRPRMSPGEHFSRCGFSISLGEMLKEMLMFTGLSYLTAAFLMCLRLNAII